MSSNTPFFPKNDFDIFEGTKLGQCYKVQALLGEGCFGFVTKCLNTKTNKAVAIKVNKNDHETLEQAKSEIFILEQLKCLDPESCNIIKWNGFFIDRERICLNFELLDQSLYDYMRDRNNHVLPVSELRPVVYQLANALSHLSSIGIVHTDLKPDNVMVVDRHQSPIRVKVIDFGLASPVSALDPGVAVQSFWYRAPEVMLYAPFNQAIDMWSLGLIAAELAIGRPLYPGKMEYDTLRFIIHTQGQPPDCVLDRGFATAFFFIQENCGNQQWRLKSEEEFKGETGSQPQDTRFLKLKRLDDIEQLMKVKTGCHSGQDLFVGLIKQMLHLDANQRITPSEVLQHPFFEQGHSQSSSRDPCTDTENTEDQILVLSQQPCSSESESPHSFDSSVQDPSEWPEQSSLSMSVDAPSFPSNDSDIFEGTKLGQCYKVKALLGEGCFGFVTKCLNTKTNNTVAIKVNKNDRETLEQAKSEIFILEQLKCLDPESCNIIKWNGFFIDKERICLNFELLDQSLHDYMRDRNNHVLPVSELRPVVYQLANALSHLSSIGIVHTDLKPDNVMVVDRHQSPIKVKVIDFGLASPVSALDPGVAVQSLWYRAPEVILCAPFNQAIDMWSLGLIAAELAIGRPLYPGKIEYDTLRFIIHTQGQPPDCVLDRGFVTSYYFIQESCGNQQWRLKSEEEFEEDTGSLPQDTRFLKLKRLDDIEQLMKVKTGCHSGQDLFVGLIKQMLHLDANQRITPSEVLQHPFFEQGHSQSSSRDPCTDTENTEEKILVLSQQPCSSESESPHSFDSSVQDPSEWPEQSSLSMSVDAPSFPSNDSDIFEGTKLGQCYKVKALLGEGCFGFVTKCLNTKTNNTVAIKVNKNDRETLEQAKSEIFILEQLKCLDPESCNIIKWNGFFIDKERICLNFELLDQSLHDYMRDRNNHVLPVSELRPVVYQLANALSHLSSIGIVHTDLKPDNVMVVDRHQSPIKVKVIDFGLASPVSALDPGVAVQSLWYRAPEVILCAPFNQAIDMWSLGLIAAELAIGRPLYPGKIEYDTLRFIIHTQGQPPDCVLDRGFVTSYYFIQESCGNQQWRLKSEEEFEEDTGSLPQDTRFLKLKRLDDIEQLMKVKTGCHSGQDLFVGLIKQMLHLDANQRITPSEVLQHPFFEQGHSQSSSRDPCTDTENTEDQILVLSQQPCSSESESPHSFDSSVQDPSEWPEQSSLSMSVDAPSFPSNDSDIFEGTKLGQCYKVKALLGEGCFGFVTKCLSTKTNNTVAIKVNKNDRETLEQAKSEIFILEQLKCLDPESCNIIKWNGFFIDKERICLNFELLDQSLHDYMRDRNNHVLPVSELRPVVYQLANALSHLSSIGIVHTDLKPDNVMVVDRHQSPIKVKVIDFGLASPVSALDPGVAVQSLWYRAPEVILCAPFNQAIDMWSLGLIAAELAIGRPLYPGKIEYDTLRFIIHTQGQPPDCVLDRGFVTSYYFIQESCGNQQWRLKSEEEFEEDTGSLPQDTRFLKLKRLDDIEQLMKVKTGCHSGQDLFVGLIKQMLHLDANQRITPSEVLRHPFFEQGHSQSSSRDPCTDTENTEDQILVLSQQPCSSESESPHSIDCSVQDPSAYLISTLSSNNEELDIQYENINQS